MTNILGLDLGTNSIGWAIRDVDSGIEDQIIDYGVITFKKGVGDGKSGEYSLAAERTANRSKRRLYNAKRYRKWATLLELSKNGMCPISEEELRLWSIGNWENGGKNKGRKYPTSPDFHSWLMMDFDHFKRNNPNDANWRQFDNIYELRSFLLGNYDNEDKYRLQKIGRVFYHLVQRRGFKTSRKNGKTSYADNELFKKFKETHPDKADWKPSQIYLYLQSGQDDNPELRKVRIRNNAVIQRALNEEEFFSICQKQNIDETIATKIHKAIYFVRPLRTQKGLVGKCTLEKGKPRIPISNPLFEEFRALTFINNLQWRETNSKGSYKSIPIVLKQQILEKLFFRRFERGKNKGKIDDSGTLLFEEIINNFSERGKWEFNFKNKPNISTCPVIAGLMNVFDEEWKDKFITDENKYGINWTGLTLAYKIKYNGAVVKDKALNFLEIWHLLFDYLQTKDDEDGLVDFCRDILGWNEYKITQFLEISLSQGYGSLSQNAINKILPYLQEGFIYSEAVSFANLKTVLGKEKFNQNKKIVTVRISNIIKTIDLTKTKLNIVNSLIQDYFADNNTNRAKGVDDQIKEMAYEDVKKKLKTHFGEEKWDEPDNYNQGYCDYIFDKYLNFLEGKQSKEEKASASADKNPLIDYYKLPRLDEAIKDILKIDFNATDIGLKKLYHPSDIDIYSKAKYSRLEDPNPPSKGWKNPMAMRSMYELRKLINYLLEEEKIDIDTKIVIEMARELNDANKRWAIQTYQRYREEENKEFARAIIGVAKEKYPHLNEDNADDIDKIRLWWEQIENGEEIYKTIKTLKEDVDKYRLWKEQECMCIYSGKPINITNLFDGVSYDFEHTLPLSQSFDNSLSNLTVCHAGYNRNIKKNKMPAQLGNYENDYNGYSAIKPRLEKWTNKVTALREKIEKNRIITKGAIRSGDVNRKNELIQQRHLLQFDLDYWDKKVKAFTLTELPNWWKNSQLVDTQIISKYARAYLKTLFNKVTVEKGSVTAEFRKIYGIMGNEKKDRSKHSHHAKDAAVLTLIPGSAKREEILKKHYLAIEQNRKFQEFPYNAFNISHIQKIEKDILINHLTKDQTLSATKKKVRKRGKIVYNYDGEGNKIAVIAQGDSIRGRLHKETFFGAVKVPERNEEGFAIKENGKYLIKQKSGEDEIWIVTRKLIDEVNIEKDIIVDEVLKKHIKKQIEGGKQIGEATDFQDKPIRHIRCRVRVGKGFLSNEKALTIKKHVFLSKHKHKQDYLSLNEENYIFLLYEGLNEKQQLLRDYKILNLFEVANLNLISISALKLETEFKTCEKKQGKMSTLLPLKAILKSGNRVIFFKENRYELKDLLIEDVVKRLYRIVKFNELGANTAYVYLQHHLEARPDSELEKGDKKLDFLQYQPRLEFTCDKMNCAIEDIDFRIHPDGRITWLF
jgi:CRISPR-associated endonuclease Csn1